MRTLVVVVVILSARRWPLGRSWDEFTQWRWVTIRDQARGFPF
jgi:hypothetical protein